jgi:UDP-N-acetyl-D-glucosamine dehydrogenase
VLIVTDHDDVDYSMVAKHGRLVLDTRNAMTRAGLAGSHIRKA